MGVIFQTSFDHYTLFTDRFNSAENFNSGTTSVTAGIGRNGTAGGRITDSQASILRKTLPATYTDVYMAFAFRTSRLPAAAGSRTIAIMSDAGTTHMMMIMRSDGTIQVGRGTGASISPSNCVVLGTLTGFAMLANTYYHFEWYVRLSDTVGLVQMRVNEIEKLNLTGQDTRNGASAIIDEIGIGAAGEVTNTANNDFDDVVVRDDAFSGDVEIAAIFATGAGTTTQWTPSAGSNYQNIDETAPNGDTDYNSNTVVNDLDTFPFQDISTTATVHAVVSLIYAKKTDAGTSKIVSMVRSGGVNYASATEHAPSLDAYEYAPTVYMTNPDTGVAWTAAGVNAAEFGYKRTA